MSTSCIRLEYIPRNTDFYRAKKYGRVALPEDREQAFITRFGAAVTQAPRDYRNLLAHIHQSAQARGYTLPAMYPLNPFHCFRNLWQEICRDCSSQSHDVALARYGDVFVCAILDCPLSATNLFEKTR